MSNTFKDFLVEREGESDQFGFFYNSTSFPLEEAGLDIPYKIACSSSGIKMLTSRQPAQTHAVLVVMEKYIYRSTKADIIYEALSSAWVDFIQSCPDEVKKSILKEVNEELKTLTESIKNK